MIPPRQVFDNPDDHWAFLTTQSDDHFEGQHFERKQAGRLSADPRDQKKAVKELLQEIKRTVSAFANSNSDGGLLVLGIGSSGEVKGINHLTEQQRNSLTDISSLLTNQSAEIKSHSCPDSSGDPNAIGLIYVPYAAHAICEEPGRTPKAWIRSGSQNLPLTQERRDRLRAEKKLFDIESAPCCPFTRSEIDDDVFREFRRVYRPGLTRGFSDERILYEAGAIVKHQDEYWLTVAGTLFFASNPQRALPWSYVRLLRFDVPSPQFTKRGLPTLDEQFTGPVTKQIRDARNFFRNSGFFKRYQKRKPSGGFREEPEFPTSVIDEAIVNAVVHRDYHTQRPIECERYPDAFIVKNPGRVKQRHGDLPDRFSLDEWTLDSTPRNPRLLEWFRLMRDSDGASYVQALSEGTKQMLLAMTDLSLPPPVYRLGENETLVRLENRAEGREAAMLGARHSKSTEFANLFSLQVRRGEDPVEHKKLQGHYRDIVSTFRDGLIGSGWYIDRAGFSRIIAHRRGKELHAPGPVRGVVRFYPAYLFQVRQYFRSYYLCVDYRCQIHNVQSVKQLAHILDPEELLDRRCVGLSGGWRKGRITALGGEFTRVLFRDSGREENVGVGSVIPQFSIDTIAKILEARNITFDLPGTIKRYSLLGQKGSARVRAERVLEIAQHVAATVFPIRVDDFDIDVSAQPVRLPETHLSTPKSLRVARLREPTVEFHDRRASPDVRTGITTYGAYETEPRQIEIIPLCSASILDSMSELIRRLRVGSHRYLGAERTFQTSFSYRAITPFDRPQDVTTEIQRLLDENPQWCGDAALDRIFLVHTPTLGYARDDEEAPYYVGKRMLLEHGIPVQMVDTATVTNPEWKDLNLALNIVAKCGVKPWVLPDSVPHADFFVGISYTKSRDGQRIMGFANVFNSYGRWEFYSGNTSYFAFEERRKHLGDVVRQALLRLDSRLSVTPRVVFHYSAKMSRDDMDAIVSAAREVRPMGVFTFVWVNTHHTVRLYDEAVETDGSLRRGTYVVAGWNKVYLSTTGYNQMRRMLGTPKPLELTVWVRHPKGLPSSAPDLRVLALQTLSLTKLNWASTDAFCGEPITVKYASNIAYLTAAFLRKEEPFRLHPVLETTPWFI